MTDKLKPVAYATKSFLESITGLGDIVTFKNDSDDLQKCEKIGLYDQQQVDQLQAQIAELQAKVGGISGVDLKDGWISWDGMGDRPVSGETIVDLRNNRGSEIRDRADVFNWRRGESLFGYIIAYRVVKP